MFRFQLLYRLRGNYSNNQLCSSVLQLLPSRRKLYTTVKSNWTLNVIVHDENLFIYVLQSKYDLIHI